MVTHRIGVVGTGRMARARIELWSQKLAIVEHALAVELQKPYRFRRTNLLHFLHREKTVCTNVISELGPFADEGDDTSGES